MQADELVSASVYSHQMTCIFANHTDENVTYHLTVQEIADAKKDNTMIQQLSKQDGF